MSDNIFEDKKTEPAGLEKIKQRALKLSEALYRTTDLFYDGEPLKWSLRETGLKVFNIVTGLKSEVSHQQIGDINQIQSLIKTLLLKLELASSSSFVSKTNFEVLQREYHLLYNLLSEYGNPPTLLLEMSDVSRQSFISDTLLDSVSDKNNKSDMTSESDKLSESKMPNTNVVPEKNFMPRKEMILTSLRTNGPSGIGKLTKLFEGAIGEKTVQRELNSMVSAGTVKQDGEKRWRRYFL